MSRSMMIGATSLSGGSGGGVSGVNTLHLNDGILTQRAEVSSSVSLDVTNITASVYFLVRQFSGTMTVFSKYQDGIERSWSMDIDPISRKLSAKIYVGGTLFTATQTGILAVDTWYNGSFTYDGSDLKLYLDADLKDTVVVLGPEEVTNGAFTTDTTGWAGNNTTLASVSGQLEVTIAVAAGPYAYQTFPTEIGKEYTGLYDIIKGTTPNNNQFRLGTGPGNDAYIKNQHGFTSLDNEFTFTALTTTTTISIGYGETAIGQTSYWDNISVKSTATDLDTSTAKVKIGARGANIVNEQPFIGDTALAIIYPTDILQAGITELSTPKDPSLYTAGMVMGLPLNFGSDARETDTSGNGNDATLINGPDYTGVKLAIEQNTISPPVEFAVNMAALDGSTKYFNAGNPSELQLSTGFTFNAWVKPAVSNAFMNVISKYDPASQRAFKMYVGTNGVLYATISFNGVATATVSSPNSQYAAGELFMFSASFNGTTLKIFKHGLEAGSGSSSGTLFNTSADFLIGGDTGSEKFNGSIGMPLIWNAAKSDADILKLNKSGGGNDTTYCFNQLEGLSAGLTTGLIYAPELVTGLGHDGDVLIDQSPSEIITSNEGTTLYTTTGLKVICT